MLGSGIFHNLLNLAALTWNPALLVASAALALAVAVMGALGVFRPGAIMGPRRLDEANEPVWPLTLAVAGAFLVYYSLQAAYVQPRVVVGPTTQGGESQIDLSRLNVNDLAYLSTVPPLAGLGTLLAADFLFAGASTYRRLGFGLRLLPRGIGLGVAGSVAIMPLMYAVLIALESLYGVLRYEHPAEHQLLRAMKDAAADPGAKRLLILGAALIAPIVEELFFRGHLQTILRQTLIHFFGKPAAYPAAWPALEAGAADAVLHYESLPPRKVLTPHVWQTWVAVLITSTIFMMAHDAWMRPAIFILSIGLGYCYERTGNLWACITIHCLFNSISTFLYLTSP